DVALYLQTRPAAPPVDADVHHHPTRRHAVPPRVHQPHFPARQHRRQQHDGSAPRSADHHPHSMYAASSSHGRYSYGSTRIISPATAMYTPPKSTYRFTTSPYGSRATSQSSIGSAHAMFRSVSWTTWTRSWARSRPWSSGGIRPRSLSVIVPHISTPPISRPDSPSITRSRATNTGVPADRLSAPLKRRSSLSSSRPRKIARPTCSRADTPALSGVVRQFSTIGPTGGPRSSSIPYPTPTFPTTVAPVAPALVPASPAPGNAAVPIRFPA